MNRMALRSLAALSLALAACDGNFIGLAGGVGSGARIRVVNALPGTPVVDVLVDGRVVAASVSYGSVTPYLRVEPGAGTLEVRAAGSTTALLQVALDPSRSGDFTVVASTAVSPLGSPLIPDDNSAPATGQRRLRLVHAAPAVPAVDVYVTAPGASLGTPAIAGVSVGTATSYLTESTGSRQIRLTVAGSPSLIVADSGPITLAAGSVTSLLLLDRAGGGLPLQLVVVRDGC